MSKRSRRFHVHWGVELSSRLRQNAPFFPPLGDLDTWCKETLFLGINSYVATKGNVAATSTILISRTIVHSKSHSIHLKAGDTNPEVFCSAKKFVFSLLSRFFERNRNDQHGRPGQLIPSLGFSKNFRQSKVTGENGSWNAITTLFLKRCSRTFQGLGFLFFLCSSFILSSVTK